MAKSNFLYLFIFIFCISNDANSAGPCLPDNFTYVGGEPKYSKGLKCTTSAAQGSAPDEGFFLLTENSTIIKEILFESEVPTSKICPTSRGLDFLKFGDYSLNRSTLDLLKNEEQFGSCIMSSVEAVKEAAKEYLASRLSKNKI